MNAKTLIAAAILAVSASAAFANEITIDARPYASQKTRAEVSAEVRRGLAAGETYVVGEGSAPVAQEHGTPRSRAEVVAEVRRDLAAGKTYHVGEGYAPVAQDHGMPRSRAEVLAELFQARESGELAALQSEVGVNDVAYTGTAGMTGSGKRAFAARPMSAY